MKISLLKDKKMVNFKLPNKIDGNVWITDIDDNENEKNIINVEATKDGQWRLISNNDYYVMENGKRVSSLVLTEYKLYNVKSSFNEDNLLLYCHPTYEENITFYSITPNLNSGIVIGSNSDCNITYQMPYVSGKNAEIIMQNGNLVISSLERVYVNNVRVNKQKILSFGDVIFIMGLKIVFFKYQNDYILGINNPNSLMKTALKQEKIVSSQSMEKFDESNEEKEMTLYTDEDYFYRKPRFIYSSTPLKLNIDTPPSKKEDSNISQFLSMGSMLTMGITSMVTLYTTISNMYKNKQTIKDVLPGLIIAGAMLMSSFVWPIIINRVNRSLDKKKEKERQDKYSAYINKQREAIFKEKSNQENILNNRFVKLSECSNIIINKKDRLWEKRVEDEDFLSVSLGYGTLPMSIEINYPDEHFSMIEDNLLDVANELKKSQKILDNVPIPFSFSQNYISAIIGKDNLNYRLIKNIILQLATFHSYDNLKIVILTSRDREYNWSYFKVLPHLFTNDKTIRYMASNQDEYKEVFYNLEKVYLSRKDAKQNSDNIKYDQNYLIITDSFNHVRNYDFIENLIENKSNLGFSIIILNDKISSLPDQCQTFIELDENESKIFKNISNSKEQKFKLDIEPIDFYKCFKALANIPIEINDDTEGIIPKKVGFLEMYNVGKVEQLNSKNRWDKNVPILNMSAIVGVGKNGDKIALDLHEKFHGPHGLVAGMTGSGKSEFIITYILSMAINYHPNEVQFILIDYKGGGLAGAFENQNLGYKLPHLVGVITNLDKTEINRSLASIESELKRRQALFNKARELSGESTIDIYKYQKMYRNHVVDEPVSHLFIIADEFAELKTQQPEFMEQLISTARIGRSLGVHLILATQKPSGVVDSQIWSNTRFRVCFRVQEKSDSTEVIQCPDAAYLTQTGRFYLQVGYNEIFVLGQSAWAGGKYIPSENIKKTIDSSVNFINNVGYVLKTVETKKEDISVDNSMGEELINIVKYLCNCANEEGIQTKPLWLERIPSVIYVNNLINKYNYQKQDYVLNPVIGEYDVPNMQKQYLLTVPFSEEGNALVYGIAGSGKENFITSLIYSSMITYTPNEVNYYILDFGAEILRYFDNSPLVGDILYISDEEKIRNLFKMVSDTINERKKLFANYNGSYEQYCKNSGNVLPNIVIVINNYEAYNETYPDYEELISVLTRDCIKYGIYFLITLSSPNGIRFKIKQNFNQNFVLQQNNEDDYATILGNVHNTYPSKIFGRGIIKKDDIYEFQTAFSSDLENLSKTIEELNDKLNQTYQSKAKRIPVLPEVVVYEDIMKDVTNNETAIGIDKNSLNVCTYNFRKNLINVISSQDSSLFDNFISPFIYQFTLRKDLINIVINADDMIIDDQIKQRTNYFDGNYDGIFDAIIKTLTDADNLYKQNGFNKNIFNDKKKYNCIIIGINAFKNKLSVEKQTEFSKLFTTGNDTDIINYIFVDTMDKIKNIEFESWYKDNSSKSDLIWIGSGLGDQFNINISTKIPEMAIDVPNNFLFVIKRGKPRYVKYIEKITKE